ncbi:MAG: M24 family metallopeptidase [Verrucomicrobiota bacterium]|nr:M24 family metallopeptidase [Verrucomicrobiota bacterium]
MKKSSLPKLIFASPETNADLLYATRFFAPDPFLFLEYKGRRVIVLSDLEVDRGRKQAQVDDVLALSEERKRLGLGERAPMAQVIAGFLRARRIPRVAVPASFPLGLAQQLNGSDIRTTPRDGMFYPEREAKAERELELIRRALEMTAAGLKRGLAVLRASEIGRKNVLRWAGRVLTAEKLRAEIESAILHAGGVATNTIVAGGEQACDPHERGSGPLEAHSLIILDVFPRDAKSGYFGDMTRTVVRGRATDAQRRLWNTVKQGQARALKAIEAGAHGNAIEKDVKAFFAREGYPMEQHDGRWRGMFHGLGHGLGLELHEHLRMSRTKLKPGQVFTVEPGLYWPGLGGAREEDVVVVAEGGCRMLSRLPKTLEI